MTTNPWTGLSIHDSRFNGQRNLYELSINDQVGSQEMLHGLIGVHDNEVMERLAVQNLIQSESKHALNVHTSKRALQVSLHSGFTSLGNNFWIDGFPFLAAHQYSLRSNPTFYPRSNA